MDQELRAYLESMEARMDERFARVEARMDERDARMEARMDERDARMEARMDERDARIDERFERMETEVRHTRVLIEGMDGKIRLLAEGVIGTSERIDSLRAETTGRLEEIKGSVDMIHRVLVPHVQSVENRVKILEDKAERENRDVLEVIRERILRQA